MKRKRTEDFPEAPAYNDRGVTSLDDETSVQLRHAIGCIHKLFGDLAKPPRLVQAPILHHDDESEFVEVQYSNTAAIPIELSLWARMHNQYMTKLHRIGDVTFVNSENNGSHTLCFTIRLNKK